MYNCKGCQYYIWDDKYLCVKCKLKINIDNLYRINWNIDLTNKDDKIKIVGNIYENKDLIKDMNNY